MIAWQENPASYIRKFDWFYLIFILRILLIINIKGYDLILKDKTSILTISFSNEISALYSTVQKF